MEDYNQYECHLRACALHNPFTACQCFQTNRRMFWGFRLIQDYSLAACYFAFNLYKLRYASKMTDTINSLFKCSKNSFEWGGDIKNLAT